MRRAGLGQGLRVPGSGETAVQDGPMSPLSCLLLLPRAHGSDPSNANTIALILLL